MTRTSQTPDHRITGGARYPWPVHLAAVACLSAGLALGGSAPAHAAEPDPDVLSEETHGGVALGEGAGAFPVDAEFDLMLAAEDFDIPETVEIWALSTEGDSLLIGSGETESETYQNPGSPTYPEVDVELIEVHLPSSEVPASDWYAFAAVDESDGALVTWTAYPVLLEDDPRDFDGSEAAELWPVPDHSENTEPSSEPPTLETLTEDTYGVVSIMRDDPVIPVDEDFTVEVETSVANADLWLLPPGGEEALFLPAQLAAEGDGVHAEYPRWNTSVSSSDVEYNGIYGLVATHESDGLIGWAPFAVSVDGESLHPGDPGVHETEAGYSDRSIWPIPDSVPGPEEGAAEDPDEDATSEPENEETGSPEPEGADESGPADAGEAPDTDNGTSWLVPTLAIAGGALIVAGIAYLIGSRRPG